MDRKNLANLVMIYLVEQIDSYNMKPGDPIKEEAISKKLGVSRTPVRETLLLLSAGGFIEQITGKGYIIRSFSMEDLKEIYFLRELLEIAALKTAFPLIKLENLQLHWCKGEYYKSSKIKEINHLIYPVPDPNGIFLGIHLTINLHGEVRFGPNAYYVDKLNYDMDETYKLEFLKAIRNYMKIDEEYFNLDDCGIRAKLQKEGEEFRDFYIKEESEKGFPNFINCIGIESPGLTCCIALAQEVRKLIKS